MKGSPGFQEVFRARRPRVAGERPGHDPAMGDVGLERAHQRVDLVEVLCRESSPVSPPRKLCWVAREAELLEQQRLVELGSARRVIVDVRLGLVQGLGVAALDVSSRTASFQFSTQRWNVMKSMNGLWWSATVSMPA